MGRGLAMNAARRVRHAVSGQSVCATPAILTQAKTYDYERVGLSAAEGRQTRPVRLGGKGRIRIAALQEILNTPSNLISKLWASYGKLRETAKETNVSVYDLFVGNQMLGQVCATPMRSYKKKPAVVPIQAGVGPPRNSRVSSSSKVTPPKASVLAGHLRSNAGSSLKYTAQFLCQWNTNDDEVTQSCVKVSLGNSAGYAGLSPHSYSNCKEGPMRLVRVENEQNLWGQILWGSSESTKVRRGRNGASGVWRKISWLGTHVQHSHTHSTYLFSRHEFVLPWKTPFQHLMEVSIKLRRR